MKPTQHTDSNSNTAAREGCAHTPDPWQVQDYVAGDGFRVLGRQIVGADGSVVARWLTNPTEESNANQSLICRAVNCHDRLLAALRAVVAVAADYEVALPVPAMRMYEIAREAIAKAEGRA